MIAAVCIKETIQILRLRSIRKKGIPMTLKNIFSFCIILIGSLNAFAASYNPNTGRATLNSIIVGDKRYQVELQHTGNGLFDIVSMAPSSIDTADGIYDLVSGRAKITAIAIDGNDVPAELFLLNNNSLLGNLNVTEGGQTDNYNREAVVPPMCYTKTESKFNPCYTCHQDKISGVNHENRMDDGFLQGDYNFSDIGTINRWGNLFIDRTEQVNAISDQEILDYIRQDNYSSLSTRLKNSHFSGWIPDLENLQNSAQAFNEDGFAKDGSYWVAFNYKPLPSTFWPTNGSTDDVMIRLPESFRNNSQGQFSKSIYIANLTILEAAVKNLDTLSTPPLDENELGADLNNDGQMGVINEIIRPDHYLGAAADVDVVSFLYPKGTEFMHTVRYVDVNDQGETDISTRMKEVRYMKKNKFIPKHIIGPFYDGEHFEKEQGHLPYYKKNGDKGLSNVFGWVIQGFIEDQQGELRTISYEENFFCMGCHSTIGSTIDKVFSFARKVDGADGWGYINLKSIKDVPAKGETNGEYEKYLQIVGGGDEFRQNQEMIERWFHADGTVKSDAIGKLDSIYPLITPSVERALMLDKAYRVIVKEQSYIRGRDATVKPATNVLKQIDVEIPPLPDEKHQKRDMRLEWGN